MAEQSTPKSVKRFIFLYLDSVELLNVLLLLQRSPGKSWTISEIERELRSSKLAIQKRLEALYSRKILKQNTASPDLHLYEPFSPELSKTIDEIAEYSQTHLARVIELIYSRQTESLKNFADAFRIKKDESDDS